MKSIRCSMLPSWIDCPRRATARQFKRLVESRGYELRRTLPSIGAAIGTAVHHAAAVLLTARQKDNASPLESTLADAIAEFQKEIDTGVEWDDTTRNQRAAYQQIESLTRAYVPIIEKTNPILVEEQFEAGLSDGWKLTGKIDLFTEERHLDDLKTGSLSRPYIQQAGGYTLLLEANGHKVKSAGTTFIKRVSPKKPQPPTLQTTFDLDAARRSAYATAQAIMRDVEAFEQSGDPYDIPANPMSLMCSDKYCPAWGTEFCKVHLRK